MKRRLCLYRLLAVVAAFCFPLQHIAQTKSQTLKYNEEHPLVYEDAWDFWPYAYLNEHGEPEGYNIDLVKLLCERMGIPYIIKLKSQSEALKDLEEGRSDLMMSLQHQRRHTHLRSGKSVILLFTQSVVYPIGQQEYVKTLDDLSRQNVFVHNSSFIYNLMKVKGWQDHATPYSDMKAVMRNVSTEGKGQIVWNTLSLKWLMKKFQIVNLHIQAVDAPQGEYKFLSQDSLLLANLDEAFTKLSSQHSELEAVQNRWFYPDLVDTGIPRWVWYIAIIVAAIAAALVVFSMTFRRRAQAMSMLSRKNTKILSQILRMSQMSIWIYDVKEHSFSWVNTDESTSHKLNSLEFGVGYNHEDFEKLCDCLRQMAAMEEKQMTVELRTSEFDNQEFSVVLSVLNQEDGKPLTILGTMINVTDERQRQRNVSKLLVRYKSIFETAMVDMVYYDSTGLLSNLNKRAMHTFNMNKEQARAAKININRIIEVDGFDQNTFEIYHATLTQDSHNIFLPENRALKGKVYYELQLVPVRNKEGQLLGIYGTGREVTEFVNSWRQRKEHIQQLAKANEKLRSYVDNIDYVMKVGGVRIVRYSPFTHLLSIYKETNDVQYTLTQARCMMLTDDSSKKRAMRLINNLDSLTPSPFETEVLTTLRHKGNRMYVQMSLIPTYNNQGQVDGYFGMCRDVTEMKITEQQLAREAIRAREVEELKNSFLRNMSYEIRTPLNTVVGFAELFEMEHSLEDESIFVQEIKNNAAHLLELINDILFLSRLDARMIEINKQPTDFSQTFEAHCRSVWDNNQREGVRYLAINNYEQLIVNIDDSNLGFIIRQVVTNAVQHTDSGMVRARYDYIEGKLVIIVDDTGCGISESAMKDIYKRFNSANSNGTGLGLPICKELSELMGGHIDVNSQEGKGTTVWIIIPCEMTAMTRKIGE